jgi:hypothetical protein
MRPVISRVWLRVMTVAVGSLLGGALTVVPAAGQPAADVEQIRSQFVGSYRLAWYKGYDKAGQETTLPYSGGQISYDRAGRMSVFLIRNEQKKFASATPTESERAAAYSSVTGYFGGYDIDPVKRSITYHVEGAMNAGMIGSDLIRYFEFSKDGATLFLTIKEGDRMVGRLQWDKYR